MLRISAVLGILVGLLLAYKSIAGFVTGYQYTMAEEHAFVTEHFALQCLFAGSAVLGGALALWRGWYALLATAWGIVIGLTAPHLIHPTIPAAELKHMVANGGTAYVSGVDPLQYAVAVVAVVGFGLCIAREIAGPSNRAL
jgi:hypothetical protein